MSMLDNSITKAIQLANLNFSPRDTYDSDSPTINPFDTIPLNSFSNSPNPQRKKSFKLPTIAWDKIENGIYMMLPIVLHTGGIAFLAYAMFQQSSPYFELHQTPGSGRLQYGITGSCAIVADTIERICGHRSFQADFVPSLELVAGKMPGFSALVLPFYSFQTPVIFLCSLLLISISFIIFVLPWSLAYYPKLPYPRLLKSLIRDNPRRWYEISGVLAFISFVMTLTIGIGYQLYLISANSLFSQAIYYSLALGLVGVNGSTGWAGVIGTGFRYVWVACAFQGATVVGINIALHNRIDRIIERGGEDKQGQNYYY